MSDKDLKTKARGGNYKFKSLKVFGSSEYLGDNSPLYRQVFDSAELRYVYFELYFHNKLFDELSWTTTVRLVCTSLHDNEEICATDKDVVVNKDQEHIRVEYSWGTKDGGWWKKGSYKVEAFINETKVGTERKFYITDAGVVTKKENPFFSVENIRLFEGLSSAGSNKDREYCVGFKKGECRWLYTELTLNNKLHKEAAFPLELFLYYYNDRGQLKGHRDYFQLITNNRKKLVVNPSWGTKDGGYWVAGNYTIKVVFMNELIATIPFSVGEKKIALTEGNQTYSEDPTGENPTEFDVKATFEEAKEHLDALIGLHTVKAQIDDLATYLQFLKIRQSLGLEKETKPNLHLTFTGNPGTGKTTVARMLAGIYHSLGLLENDTLIEAGRAELVGEFIGQTAPKMDKLLEEATGGVLFIDEAYSLSSRGEKDFGKEVVERLLKELEDNSEIAIIFAGYPAEMEQFLSSNPGLKSRLPNVIHFPDYTPDELMQIKQYACKKQGVLMDEEANTALFNHIVEVYRTRDKHFGNARYINGIVREGKKNLAVRLMREGNIDKISKNTQKLSTITLADVEVIFSQKESKSFSLPIDEALFNEALRALNQLVGLSNLKKDITDMAKLVRYYREIGKDIRSAFSLHSVFTGNPGTGKTTVARIFAQIFKSLGILERGHLVECSRKDLVAGYVGQTAPKTSEMISKAKGGVLFIDEAYSLTSTGSDNDFGKEVVETLLKRMEDERGEFIVIAAGYPNEMKAFLQSNPGLESRFDKSYSFEDYTQTELMAIALKMVKKDGMQLDIEAQEIVSDQIGDMLKNKDRYFGNARSIRKLVSESIQNQHLRMAGLSKRQRTAVMIKTIMAEDIVKPATEETKPQRGMGFSMD